MPIIVHCAECGTELPPRPPSNVFERNYCNRSCLGRYRSKHYVGEKAAHWQGGTKKDRDRIMVYAPDHPAAQSNGYVYRYRLVAEAAIGRPLLPSEIVHHIDGNDDNDAPENLMVMTQSLHASQYDARRPRRDEVRPQ